MALSKAQKAALDAKREEARLDEVRQESANNYLEFLKAKEAGLLKLFFCFFFCKIFILENFRKVGQCSIII